MTIIVRRCAIIVGLAVCGCACSCGDSPPPAPPSPLERAYRAQQAKNAELEQRLALLSDLLNRRHVMSSEHILESLRNNRLEFRKSLPQREVLDVLEAAVRYVAKEVPYDAYEITLDGKSPPSAFFERFAHFDAEVGPVSADRAGVQISMNSATLKSLGDGRMTVQADTFTAGFGISLQRRGGRWQILYAVKRWELIH